MFNVKSLLILNALTNLSNKLDFDSVVLESLSWIFESHVHFSAHRLSVVEEKIFVFLPILGLVLYFLSGFGIIENDIYLSTLSEAEETHTGELVHLWETQTACGLFRLAKRSPAAV